VASVIASVIASAKQDDDNNEDPDPIVRAAKEAAAATVIHEHNTSQLIFVSYYDGGIKWVTGSVRSLLDFFDAIFKICG